MMIDLRYKFVTIGFAVFCSQLPAASDAEDRLVVTNVQFGLVCGANDNRRVCFQTRDIQITNEGRCVYNRQPYGCTWYGFSFDYQPPAQNLKIQCESTSDMGHDIGNPEGILQRNAATTRYEVELRSGTHHFFNPQYAIASSAATSEIERQTESCSYGGEKLFEFELRIHYPEH